MRFKILHGFRLRSANKILMPGMLYATDKDEEIKELRDIYVPHKAAEEIVPVEKADGPKAPEKSTVDPEDDVTLVDGIGAGLSKKLAAVGITTKSGLAAVMVNSARAEEMKKVLGNSYEKILAQFEEKKEPSTPEA